MIARIWHGRTHAAKTDEYLAFLRSRALPDYRSTPGNLAAWVPRRDDGDITHFTAVTHWQSLQAIQAFAGADMSRAKYYPEDSNFLLEFEPSVRHSQMYT